MGDGTKENPYNDEDFWKIIDDNGGNIKGLDLSGKYFTSIYDYHGTDLKEAYLVNAHFTGSYFSETHFEGARLLDARFEDTRLMGVHFEGADLQRVHLEGAFLWGAHFESANLSGAHLEEANLNQAHLDGTKLTGVRLLSNTKLEGVDWGNYIIGEEREGDKENKRKIRKLAAAEYLLAKTEYRFLKQWYTEHGIYDVAGEFFFREKTAARKAMRWWPKFWNRSFSKIVSMLCGYGEKPERVAISAAVVIFGLAVAYYFWGTFSLSSFLSTLYYSVVSFVALGYGSWAPEPIGWAKYMGAAEAVIGVFMMALFLVTFTRKMTR
jgi:hypothetical protein